MKPKTKILLLLFALLFPYMAFVLYRALQFPEHPFPGSLLYVAFFYLVGSGVLFFFLRKKILAKAPVPSIEEQKSRDVSAARALRRLGYIWLIGPFYYTLPGGPLRNPLWITLLGFLWVGFLIWASFHMAKRIEAKAVSELSATQSK
jgi:hypothetical protein